MSQPIGRPVSAGYLASATLVLTGCGYPAFTSAMRSNGFAQDAKVEGQSEYTSTARADFPSVYCFERVVGSPQPSTPAAPPTPPAAAQ